MVQVPSHPRLLLALAALAFGAAATAVEISAASSDGIELWRRDRSLALPTDGGGGISVWANMAKGWRKLLRGSFGIPDGLTSSSGSINSSALVKAYVPSLIFMVLMLFCGLTLVPITACVFCKFVRARPKRGSAPLLTLCAAVTVVSVTTCSVIGFMGGIRTGTLIVNSLGDVSKSVSALIDDAQALSVQFPAALNTAILQLRSGINTACDSVATSLDYTAIRASMGGPNIGAGPAADCVSNAAAAKTLVTQTASYATSIDSNVASLKTKVSSLQTLRNSLVNTYIPAANGPFTSSGGGTFSPATSITYSSTALDSLISSYTTQLNALQAVAPVVTAANLPAQPAFGTATDAVVSSWSDISATVKAILLSRASTTKGIVKPILAGFTDPTQVQAQNTAVTVYNSIDGFRGTVNSFINALLSPMNVFSGLVPLFLALSLVTGAAVLALVILRLSFLFKFLPIPLALLGALLLIFGSIFFLIAMALGDVCGVLDSGNGAGLAGISTSIATSVANFATARQKDCLDNDLGVVQFAIDLGLVDSSTANLTMTATPTVNNFDISYLGQIFQVEVIPATTAILATDRLTAPGQALSSSFSLSGFTSLNGLSQTSASSDATTLGSTVGGIVGRINSQSSSTSADPDFTGSVTYAGATAALPALNNVVTTVNSIKSLMADIQSTITQTYTMASYINSAGSQMTTVGPALARSYGSVTTILKAYVVTASATLTANLPRVRWLMLKAVNDAETVFRGQLSCANFGYDSLVLQDAMCLEYLTPTDALWYSFGVIGLAFAICIYSFGVIVHRLFHPNRLQAITVVFLPVFEKVGWKPAFVAGKVAPEEMEKKDVGDGRVEPIVVVATAPMSEF